MASAVVLDVEAVLGEGCRKFDAANLPVLERCVEQQLQTNSYNLECNLAVLLQYALQPDHLNLDVVRKILIKALMQLPSLDFTLCVYQIPEFVQKEPQVQPIIRLEDNLQCCKFRKVWDELKDPNGQLIDLLQVHGFRLAVQSFIAGVINVGYQAISADDLAIVLDVPVESPEFQTWVEQKGWVLEQSETKGFRVRIRDRDDTGAVAAGSRGGAANAGSGNGVASANKPINMEDLKMCFSALSKA